MIVDWIKELLDASGFMTRDHCGLWTEPLKQAYTISHALIALTYVLIGFCLVVIWKVRRHEMQCGWVLLTFAASSATCALTHVCDIVVFWWPAYRLFTVIAVASALLSAATAMWLPWLTKIALSLLTPERLENVNRQLEDASLQKDRAIKDLNATVAALGRQLDHLERMRQTGLWVSEQETALRDLKIALDYSSAKEVPR
jgi:hypothetical protein